LPEWVEGRRENAEKLTAQLEDVANVETPDIPEDRTHVFHQYTIVTEERTTLQSSLGSADVGYGVYYPMTIPDQPAYSEKDAEIPVARRLSETVLSLPVHPYVEYADIETIVDAVRAGVEVEA
jgi:dTDP-4-amino-4,6-dideoxygalactose transaminase